jgi:hypothetical protein
LLLCATVALQCQGRGRQSQAGTQLLHSQDSVEQPSLNVAVIRLKLSVNIFDDALILLVAEALQDRPAWEASAQEVCVLGVGRQRSAAVALEGCLAVLDACEDNTKILHSLSYVLLSLWQRGRLLHPVCVLLCAVCCASGPHGHLVIDLVLEDNDFDVQWVQVVKGC